MPISPKIGYVANPPLVAKKLIVPYPISAQATMEAYYSYVCTSCGTSQPPHLDIGEVVTLCPICYSDIKEALNEFLLPYKVKWRLQRSA